MINPLRSVYNYLCKKGVRKFSQEELPPYFHLAKDTAITLGGADSRVQIIDVDQNPILIIEGDGTLIWCQPEKVDEAARIFSSLFTMNEERRAGIKEARREWESRVCRKLGDLARKETLTPESIQAFFMKEEMVKRLAGNT